MDRHYWIPDEISKGLLRPRSRRITLNQCLQLWILWFSVLLLSFGWISIRLAILRWFLARSSCIFILTFFFFFLLNYFSFKLSIHFHYCNYDNNWRKTRIFLRAKFKHRFWNYYYIIYLYSHARGFVHLPRGSFSFGENREEKWRVRNRDKKFPLSMGGGNVDQLWEPFQTVFAKRPSMLSEQTWRIYLCSSSEVRGT